MEKFGFETDTVYLDFKDPWSESNYTKGICEGDAGIFFLNLLQQKRVHSQGGMTDIPGELHDGGTGGKEDIQLIVFVVQQQLSQ